MSNNDILAALRGSKLATDLDEAQLKTLSSHITARDLAPGEVLVREGTSDDHLYVLMQGALGVVRNHGGADAVTLLTLTAGDFVGELSFIDATPHYASLVALVPTRVFGLEREKLEALLPKDPELVYHVMRAIVRVVHQIQRRLSMQSYELSNYIYKQHGRY